MLGRLPWQGHISHSKEDKYYKIREIKKNTTPEELCQGLPPQIQEYVEYTRNLEYETDPDYNYLKNLFLTILKHYNWEFDYYYDWDQVGLTGSEIKDKEKDTKKDEMKINLEKVHEIPKLCTKISDLIEERKRSKDIFDQDRFVTDPEEESQFNLSTYPAESTFENNYNNTNSMTPYDYPRKHIKQSGCLPCQPKSYRKEKDDSCCIVF